VQVAGSESEAMNSGAQNVIGLSNGPADPEHGGDSYVNLGSLTGGPDTGVWNYNTLSTLNTAGHEFTHLLGTGDSYGLGVLSDTDPEGRPLQATEYDLRKGTSESARDSSFARSILRACNGQCAAASASNYRITNTTQVAAPLLPLWWK